MYIEITDGPKQFTLKSGWTIVETIGTGTLYLHNIDGPIVFHNNKKEWWLCGEKLSYNEWRRKRKPYIAERRKQELKDLVL